MADNDDYLDSIDNNHLEGTNGSLNMTDNSLGVSILFFLLEGGEPKSDHDYNVAHIVITFN